MSKKTEEKEYDILRIENGDYKTTFTRKYRERKPWQKADPREVYSVIPGTITSVEVKEGQQVRKGDTLLVFKAMKMSNTLKAHMDGRIAKIHVKPGEVIPKGIILLAFE